MAGLVAEVVNCNHLNGKEGPDDPVVGKKNPRMVKRGEIYWARLLETVGDVQIGIRPVLIIQNNVGNEFCSSVIVACITSSLSTRSYPVNVAIPDGLLPKASVVRLNQILTVGGSQLGKKMASLPREAMNLVDEALRMSLGLPKFE